MHLIHTRYYADLQRRVILEITAPSFLCKRSVTNKVLSFLTARKVLKATTASSRQRLGALSLGKDLEHFFSVFSYCRSDSQPERTILFGARTNSKGLSACRPSSANSSARSFRRHPVWLYAFIKVTFPIHRRNSWVEVGRLQQSVPLPWG